MKKQAEIQAIEQPKAKLSGPNEINEMANRVVPIQTISMAFSRVSIFLKILMTL